MTILRVIDFETTGLPSPEDQHAVVEVGYCDVVQGDAVDSWVLREPRASLCNPARAIDVQAMATHHIRERDLTDAPPPSQLLASLMRGPPAYFVAHKADFEKQFFGGGDVPWICTWKSALRVWPDAPSHSNQALRYWLDIERHPDFEPELAMPPHRAGPDAYVTALLLRELLAKTTIENLAKWSSGPALLVRVGFGKHFGKRWSEVPRDYLNWIVGKSDIDDRDVRATARFYLRQPGA